MKDGPGGGAGKCQTFRVAVVDRFTYCGNQLAPLQRFPFWGVARQGLSSSACPADGVAFVFVPSGETRGDTGPLCSVLRKRTWRWRASLWVSRVRPRAVPLSNLSSGPLARRRFRRPRMARQPDTAGDGSIAASNGRWMTKQVASCSPTSRMKMYESRISPFYGGSRFTLPLP